MSHTETTPSMFTLDESMLGSYGDFPNTLYLISVGDGKYAANNVTMADTTHNGLAAFPTLDDLTVYSNLLAGLDGDPVRKSFDEARQIAISKPVLDCVFLFIDGAIADVHFVR
ncbi:MAG: hypothetical protein IT363_10790 [Methanoregulaceae archaeon]|nr:hypothetical protein [Methanoregulaceae archaeon]